MLNSCGSQGKKRANLSSKTFEIKGIKIQGDLSMQTNVAEQTSTLIYKAPGLSFSGTITAAHSRLSCGRCPAASALAHTWSHKWYQVLLPLQVRSHFSQTVIHTPFPFPFFFLLKQLLWIIIYTDVRCISIFSSSPWKQLIPTISVDLNCFEEICACNNE